MPLECKEIQNMYQMLNAIVVQENAEIPTTKCRWKPRKYKTRLTYNCAHLRSTKESLTDSVECGTGWYLMVLGH